MSQSLEIVTIENAELADVSKWFSIQFDGRNQLTVPNPESEIFDHLKYHNTLHDDGPEYRA